MDRPSKKNLENLECLRTQVENLQEQRQQLEAWQVTLDMEVFLHNRHCEYTCSPHISSEHHNLQRELHKFHQVENDTEVEYQQVLAEYAIALTLYQAG